VLRGFPFDASRILFSSLLLICSVHVRVFFRTKEVEARLQNIVVRQGANVDEIVKLVKDNQVVVNEMTNCVKARAMQQLINIVIRTDQSRDFTIDDGEIEIMLARLRQVEYLNFDEGK
jgi:hypothetical protein